MKVRGYFRHPGWDEAQTWLDQLRDDAGEAGMPDHRGPAASKGSQLAPAPQGGPLAPRHRRPPALRLPVVWCQMGSCMSGDALDG